MLTRSLKLLIKERTTYSRFVSTSHMQIPNLIHTNNIQRNNNNKLIINNNNTFLLSNKLSPANSTNRCYSSVASTENNKEESDDDNDDENGNRITENSYAYSILYNQKKYSYLLLPKIIPDPNITKNDVDKIFSKDIDNCSPTEILDDFKIICQYNKIHSEQISEKHNPIINGLIRYINDYSNHELISLLHYMELVYPRPKIQNLIDLENEIDKELCLRFNDLTIDEKLKICHLWYCLRKLRFSIFSTRAMKKLGFKPMKFSPDNYIVYMFLLNASRIPSINIYELEYTLEGLIDKFSVEELGIIAMAFFKTKTPIRNPNLLYKMLQKCLENIDEIGDITLTAIMKVARLSINFNDTTILRKIIQAFESQLEKRSVLSWIHCAHVASTVLLYEKPSIDKILQRILKHIPELRAKDLERLLFILVTFKYPKNSPQYDLIIKEMRNPDRQSEFKKFFKSISRSLMYLSVAGIYPVDILKLKFDPEYLKETYQNNPYKIGRDYLTLDTSIQIDLPEYDGPLLPTSLRNYLRKRYSADSLNIDSPEIKIQNYQKFTFTVVNCLKEILGSKNFMVEQLLPNHQKEEVLLCLDSSNNFVMPQKYFPKYELGDIKYAPKEPNDLKWIALILASTNHVFRDTIEPTGSLEFKIRHIAKLGYTPFTILFSTWIKLGAESKKKYLNAILSQRSNIRKTRIVS